MSLDKRNDEAAIHQTYLGIFSGPTQFFPGLASKGGAEPWWRVGKSLVTTASLELCVFCYFLFVVLCVMFFLCFVICVMNYV